MRSSSATLGYGPPPRSAADSMRESQTGVSRPPRALTSSATRAWLSPLRARRNRSAWPSSGCW